MASDHDGAARASGPRDATIAVADMDGVFPEGFYATTNFPTEVHAFGEWLPVARPEMDVGVRVTRDPSPRAESCPMHHVRKGDLLVVGRDGVRVRLPEAAAGDEEPFRFMSSGVSTERPKALLIRDVARAVRDAHARGARVLFVGGPAIVHSGSGHHLEALLRGGFVDVLFAGNALATHDIEHAMFETSLGVHLAHGSGVPHGHEHHLRAINRVRRAGSIAKAIEFGAISGGIMHACITHAIPFVLAGSIRDDGPLPDVLTDTVAAADAMRRLVFGVGVAIIVATTLHGVATGNLLPSSVATFCVDTDADTVLKLVDRGTHQATGIVTDCEYFLGELRRALESDA